MGCDIHWHTEKKIDGKWVHDPGAPEYNDRDYLLFATLAGVRSSDNIVQISEPRGIPNDTSDGVLTEYEEWRGDAHTPSWFSLKELLAHDWKKPITITRMVDYDQYIEFKKNGQPQSWAKGIFGPKNVTNEELDAIIASGKGGKNYCTTITWTTPGYLDYFQDFLNEVAEYAKDTEIRIVFWFDN